MKKIGLSLLILSGLCFLGGCTKEYLEINHKKQEQQDVIDYGSPAFRAGFWSEDNTKTFVGDDDRLYWTESDKVSIFDASTTNVKYTFGGNTGDKEGALLKIASEYPDGTALSANYAIYPYNASTTISESGVFTVDMPATQLYARNSFGPGANTMVAVSGNVDDRNLSFKNVGGYLVLKLYGDTQVKSIRIFGNNSEKISGTAKITAAYGKTPTINMSGDAGTDITLDCGNGVKLGDTAATATEFWFVVPPVTFSKGFTVQVTDADGVTFSRSKITSGSISRNRIVEVNPFSVTTKAGQFVRTISGEESFDQEKIEGLLASSGIDNIPDALIDFAFGLINKNGTVKLNRIIYTTTDRDNNIVEASGLVSYPAKISNYSKILSVQHRSVNINEAPSKDEAPIEMCVAFKEGVQVVTLADYLGYGASERADLKEPYMHSDLTGTACADLVDAAQDFLAQTKGWTPKSVTIDLVGYSQGGAASISTLKELEKRGRTIGKVVAGGGPFNLNTYIQQFVDNPTVENPRSGYLALALLGLAYGDRLDVNFRNIFASRVFEKGIFDNFSRTQVSSWHRLLTTDVRNILHEDYFKPDFNNNADIIAIANSATRNSVVYYNGKYKNSIKLYHSPNDETVPYSCSTEAKKAWGCSLTDLEKDSHENAGIEFFAKYVIGYYEASSLLEKAKVGTLWLMISSLIDNNS